MVFNFTFTYSATGRYYSIRGKFNCNNNVIYLICCAEFSKMYVGWAIKFKYCFRVYKSDIKTGKLRCDAANHLINQCIDTLTNSKVQLIEIVHVEIASNLETKLWQREKYWLAQLFTMSEGLHDPQEWYSANRKYYIYMISTSIYQYNILLFVVSRSIQYIVKYDSRFTIIHFFFVIISFIFLLFLNIFFLLTSLVLLTFRFLVHDARLYG